MEMPEWARRRMQSRLGGEHPFADFEPATMALVVVDLQNAFMDPEARGSFIPGATDIVPRVNALASAARNAGAKVVWIQNTFAPEVTEGWSTFFARNAPAVTDAWLAAQAPGSYGHALHPSLDVQPGDLKVEKTRFSAFLPESSDLADQLRQLGCDTVVITGCATNVCCESSARDAAQMNFRTIMVSDATAAGEAVAHEAALAGFYSIFGDVLTTEQVLATLQRRRQRTLDPSGNVDGRRRLQAPLDRAR